MPKLKELSLQGFKSFADPLTLVFPTGITAIVGPNGSGKSNVADAIRWVLGEQRMTTLRGSTNEDMIFAGSKRRARSGMGRVSLTFDNADNWLPLDFAEVVVERRTYRDGKTDYILNGSKVRLMDIRDILDRAGLGRDAYLTIGQGLVDQVLSLRASERLALFEQAAGIAPYRNRREEATKRLEETRHNLQRVQDILGEIEPRLHRLERQVERAEQHEQLSAELTSRLRIWYGYRWGQSLHKLESARQRVLYRRRKVDSEQQKLDALTGRIGERRQEMARLRARLAELHRTSGARHSEAERIQRALAVARERRRSLQERQEEARANLVPLRTAQTAQEEESREVRDALEAASARLEEEERRLTVLEGEYKALEAQRHDLLRRQSSLQSRALEHRHQLTDRRSRLEQVMARSERLDKRAAELEQSLESAMTRRRDRQAAVEKARSVVEDIESTLKEAEKEVTRLETDREAVRDEEDVLRRDLATARSSHEQLTARLEALERLHAEGAGLYEGVHAVLQAAEEGQLQGIPGTFASLIRVPPRLDRAFEAALGSRLQNVVAESWEDARAAIEWLKRQRAGRATFLPLDNLRPSRPLQVPIREGVIGLAAELVSYEDPALEPAVYLLLGRVAVTEDLDAARLLHQQMRGGFQIVTLEGEILRSGGSLTGGQKGSKGRGSNLLARERERAALPARVEAQAAEAAALRDHLRDHGERVRGVEEALRKANSHRRELERQRQEAARRLERAIGDLEQLLQEVEWQRNLLGEARQEREELDLAVARLEGEQRALSEELAHTEEALGTLTADLEALADDELSRRLAERRTEVALLTQEQKNRRVLLETRLQETARLQKQIATRERRLEDLAEELVALGEKIQGLQVEYKEARAAADALSTQIPEREQELSTLEQEQETLEERETALRRLLHDAEQRLSQAEMEYRRREDRVQALRDEIEETLDIVVVDLPESLSVQQPLPLQPSSVPFPVVSELPEGLERQIRDLRTQIRRLEPVNVAAREEYKNVSARHTFLREQAADLETASAHLRQIIAELDEMMETAFRTTFRAIASEFERMFALLFNGGSAALATETSEEGEIVGVEITARPPGKRTSGLGMLSGGERALTAVALLFAVMHISPTPFCVLDEVDAMLDEANVGRFRTILRELGKQTQFLIITHNRGTVEVADTIYGVSMGEDGVSQVLSLSLEDLPPSEDL